MVARRGGFFFLPPLVPKKAKYIGKSAKRLAKGDFKGALKYGAQSFYKPFLEVGQEKFRDLKTDLKRVPQGFKDVTRPKSISQFSRGISNIGTPITGFFVSRGTTRGIEKHTGLRPLDYYGNYRRIFG